MTKNRREARKRRKEEGECKERRSLSVCLSVFCFFSLSFSSYGFRRGGVCETDSDEFEDMFFSRSEEIDELRIGGHDFILRWRGLYQSLQLSDRSTTLRIEASRNKVQKKTHNEHTKTTTTTPMHHAIRAFFIIPRRKSSFFLFHPRKRSSLSHVDRHTQLPLVRWGGVQACDRDGSTEESQVCRQT